MQMAIVFLFGAALGALAIYLFLNSKTAKIRQQLFEADKEREFSQRELERLQVQHQRELEARQAESRQLLAEKEKFTEQTIKTLREQFVNLAAETLTSRTEDLSKENRAQLSQLLTPLREQLDALRTSANEAQKTNVEIGSTMKAQLDSIRSAASSLGNQAENLATALKGGNKAQGTWGEAILTQVLQSSGLQEEKHFICQKGEAGAGIPDVQVFDPAGRVLIIDSKVSLTDYLRSCNAEDEELRARALADHVKSIRRQIDNLSRKEYVKKFKDAHPERTYINIVAMFMPNDASFAAAATADPTIVQYAFEHNVIIITPITLMAYLRIVALAWQQDAIDRNNQAIIDEAGRFLSRLDASLAALESLGSYLDRAKEEYEKSMGLFGRREGKLNLILPAEKLQKLGIRLDKARSKALNGPKE